MVFCGGQAYDYLEDTIVKHVKVLTGGAMARATAFQDVICDVVNILVAVLTSMGGSSPILNYLGDKCTVPQPNDNNTTTS